MIRLGVIGYGRRLRRVLDAVSAVDPEATVVAVVDPLGDALRRSYSERLRYATFFGSVDRLLDEGRVDGVLIGTRCSLHAQLAIKVLERDLPLFLEKPVAIEWEQLRALQAASERSRSPVVVSFPLRVSPLCEAVRGIVDAGAIGTIEQVQAVNNVPPYAATYYHGWMRDESETGGLWLQKATHDFDYITSLVRQQPVQICAVESKTVFRGEMPAGLCCADCELQRDCPESPQNHFGRMGAAPPPEAEEWRCCFAVDTGNHDSASAIIRYASGVHAVYSQNFYARRTARGASLFGYRGTIAFDWCSGELTVHYHSGKQERHQVSGGDEEGHWGGDEALAREFLAAIRGVDARRAPLDAGILSAQLCLLARESSSANRFEEVQPLGALSSLALAGA